MKQIALVSVYTPDNITFDMYAMVLLELLAERKPEESISHKEMPTFAEHVDFVKTKPYKQWYLIQSLEETNNPFVGAIYLSKDNEIGIGIFDIFKRQHYATAAIQALIDNHHEKYYYANINPDNYKSKDMFRRLGFKFYRHLMGKKNGTNKIIQETYKFTHDDV